MQVQHARTPATAWTTAVEVGAADAECRNVTAGELCYRHLVWAMEEGILRRPDWYPGLKPSSSWDEFQQFLHDKGVDGCPEPCEREEPSPDPDLVTQEGALVSPGEDLRVYFIGTSNVLWETWPDQVHAMLLRLGYVIPAQDFRIAATKRPTHAPVCDDASTYAELDTPRIGRLGWSSWGFAFDTEDDCSESGFRKILGHDVSCTNAWACNPRWKGKSGAVQPSQVSAETERSQAVVLSNWVNDGKQRYSQYKCFNGEAIDALASTELTVFSLRSLIRAIHVRNPGARIFIMALYVDATGTRMNEHLVPKIERINAAVEAGLADEPNVFFVRYDFPAFEDMYQTLHGGHPNCRGDRAMATALVEALFRHKVLSTAFALEETELCLGRNSCGALSTACCRRSALCHVAENGSCQPYGPGVQ